MSVIPNHTRIAERLKEVNFPLVAELRMQEVKTNSVQLSKRMGRERTYLHQALQKQDQQISLILLLSLHLQTNLVEPFLQILPEHLRITKQEKALQQQIADLQKQLEDVKKERDLYKEVAMK